MKRKMFIPVILIICWSCCFSQSPVYYSLPGDTIELNIKCHHCIVQWEESKDSVSWNEITGLTDTLSTLYTDVSLNGKIYYRARYYDKYAKDIQIKYSPVLSFFFLKSKADIRPGMCYGGGIVFYTDGNGHGLIASQSDQSNGIGWGCPGLALKGNTDSVNGAWNTTVIVSSCKTRPVAASICDELNLNGFDDWFLSAKKQLDRLYANKELIGNLSYDYYWSSTDLDAGNAIFQSFRYGFQSSLSKDMNYTAYVRCIRAF